MFDAQVQEAHAIESQFFCQVDRFFHEFASGFNSVDVTFCLEFEKKIVKDESQIGFSCAMVRQLNVAIFFEQFVQQGGNELIEVVYLLEFAAAILVEFSVSGQNVQRFEQFDGLFWQDIWNRGHGS